MRISLIVAASQNNVIGKDNKLIWRIPEDLKRFKRLTEWYPVIMGRKTFESIGKPLKNRINIVLSKDSDYKHKDISYVYNNIEDALYFAGFFEYEEVFIIGGEQIYKQTIDLADRIYYTKVLRDYEGDSFFPELEPKDWELTSSEKSFSVNEQVSYDFNIYDKVKV